MDTQNTFKQPVGYDRHFSSTCLISDSGIKHTANEGLQPQFKGWLYPRKQGRFKENHNIRAWCSKIRLGFRERCRIIEFSVQP